MPLNSMDYLHLNFVEGETAILNENKKSSWGD